MICHMHQPNMFMNTMLRLHHVGLRSRRALHVAEAAALSLDRRRRAQCSIAIRKKPHRAATGRDVNFLKNVSQLNPQLKDTQFADYHGHGWNFRARLQARSPRRLCSMHESARLSPTTIQTKLQKAVHLPPSHVDVGMQCVDCHFAQDNHGNGYIYGEVGAPSRSAARIVMARSTAIRTSENFGSRRARRAAWICCDRALPTASSASNGSTANSDPALDGRRRDSNGP